MRSTSSPLAVTMMMGMSCVRGSRRSAVHTVVPGRSGSIRSSNTMSGRVSRARRSPASAVAADCTRCPACVRLYWRISRRSGSSSMRTTRAMDGIATGREGRRGEALVTFRSRTGRASPAALARERPTCARVFTGFIRARAVSPATRPGHAPPPWRATSSRSWRLRCSRSGAAASRPARSSTRCAPSFRIARAGRPRRCRTTELPRWTKARPWCSSCSTAPAGRRSSAGRIRSCPRRRG